MPFDYDPLDIASPEDFTMQERETSVGEQQANVTFRVTTSRQRPLGSRGELSGIAKLDPEEGLRHSERARDLAMEEAMTRLGEIATEFNQRLNTENNLTENDRRRLEQWRDWCVQKVNTGDRTIGEMDLRNLGEYATDPVLLKATALRRQVLQQQGNNTVFATLGIQEGEERGTAMLTRAVGTSKLDQLLGTHVISEERFGVDDQGRTIGISVRVDGFGVIGKLPENREYQLDIDYSRPETQKGLYALEVIDYITGQLDRHAGNIFIDPETGEVRGIDNDLCFPSIPREQVLAGLMDARGKPVHNKPLFMHEDTARKIEELTPEQLRESLGSLKYPGRGERGKLTPEEIEGAVTRLNEMKQHVVDLRRTNHVVTEFTQETYDEAIQHQKDAYAQDRGHMMSVTARSMDTLEDPMLLDTTFKTSYIGSILCEQRKTEIAQVENVARLRLDPEGLRTETNSTGKSTRSEEHVEFARLEKERREELRPFKTAPLQEDFDRLNERVARMERRLERLEHPNLWDRFKAIWHGGVEGAKRAFEGKRQEALHDIDARKTVIEQNLNQSLDEERGGRWQQARENVQNARLPQEQVQNVGLNQSQHVDNDLVLTPEKLGMVEPPPGDLTFSVLRQKTKVGDLLKGGHDDAPKVTNEPELNVDVDDDSVRSQVGVKKTDPTTQKGQSFRTQ